MKIEERVILSVVHGPDVMPFQVTMFDGLMPTGEPHYHLVNRYDNRSEALGLYRCLCDALRAAYEQGKADGARAENSACFQLAEHAWLTDNPNGAGPAIAVRRADGIAAGKPADEEAPPGKDG